MNAVATTETLTVEALDAELLARLARCSIGMDTADAAEFTKPSGPMTKKEREAHRQRVARRLVSLTNRGLVRMVNRGRHARWYSNDPIAREQWQTKRAEREAKAAHVLAVAREQGHALPMEMDGDGDMVEPDYNDRNFSAFTVTLTADQYLALVAAATAPR